MTQTTWYCIKYLIIIIIISVYHFYFNFGAESLLTLIFECIWACKQVAYVRVLNEIQQQPTDKSKKEKRKTINFEGVCQRRTSDLFTWCWTWFHVSFGNITFEVQEPDFSFKHAIKHLFVTWVKQDVKHSMKPLVPFFQFCYSPMPSFAAALQCVCPYRTVWTNGNVPRCVGDDNKSDVKLVFLPYYQGSIIWNIFLTSVSATVSMWISFTGSPQ